MPNSIDDRPFLVDFHGLNSSPTLGNRGPAIYSYATLAQTLVARAAAVRDAAPNRPTTSLFDFLTLFLAHLQQGSDFSFASFWDNSEGIASSPAPSTATNAAELLSPARPQENSNVATILENLPTQLSNTPSRITLKSSGTTGAPKSYSHCVHDLLATTQIAPKHADDVWALTYHPTRIAAVQVLLQCVCNLNTIVNLFQTDVGTAQEAIHCYRITHVSATPTYLRLLSTCSKPFESVKRVTLGGEVCDASTLERIRMAFPNAKIRNVYAASEFGTILHSTDDQFLVPESLRNRVQIRDGRLWIRKELAAESLRERSSEEFIDSGDDVEVTCEEPLTLKVLGRRSDWINVGGNKVNPHQVESQLLEIPGVIEARVYGRANSVCGSIVCAELAVAPESQLDTRAVRQALAGKLEEYAIPRLIEFRESISITDSGKKARPS